LYADSSKFSRRDAESYSFLNPREDVGASAAERGLDRCNLGLHVDHFRVFRSKGGRKLRELASQRSQLKLVVLSVASSRTCGSDSAVEVEASSFADCFITRFALRFQQIQLHLPEPFAGDVVFVG